MWLAITCTPVHKSCLAVKCVNVIGWYTSTLVWGWSNVMYPSTICSSLKMKYCCCCCWWMRFEVLTVVAMRTTSFWNVTQQSLVEVYWRFRGTCCLHLQGSNVSHAIRIRLTLLAAFVFSLLFSPEAGGSKLLPYYMAPHPRKHFSSWWFW
jgi:hypothetical protein